MIPPKKNKRQFGLKEEVRDGRNFQLGQIADQPDVKDLPRSLNKERLSVWNQRQSDFCAAFAATKGSERQEGIALEPTWTFAASKAISGDKEQWGQGLSYVLKALCRGGLPAEFSPYSIETKPPEFLRDIDNWPDVYATAYPHRKKSYFEITGKYDHFDNARTFMMKFPDCDILTGVNWGWPITQPFLNNISHGYGHAVLIVDFDTMDNGEEVLVLQNSYGEEAGLKGFFYITRDVYNYYAQRYGHFMFLDISAEEAKKCLEAGIKLEDGWFVQMLKRFLAWIK